MNKMTAETYQGVAERAECLFDRAAVESAFDRMADALEQRLAASDPIVLSVMTGGVVTAGILLPRLQFPLRLSYVHATRYREGTRGGTLEWKYRPSEIIRGEHVLVVDDIFDEGVTMQEIVDACREDGAASVTSAVLVEKLRARDCVYRPDVVGLTTPDRYLMGYGLDYKSYFRNADGIYAAADQDV
ncbi:MULTISPECIES: hypoxanthine-guanine phosphoribosyltransferase [Thiorhodovibrio]|jgi:hypoxanthine phosphoribosyltransferase|uniref:hypoxanthine-guanine phosphoribosyltransferase n=1 Tax=Thiorhodovibrio TaxID=61593 RepID=UPI0019146C6E|nr:MULTISPECIES: hypoxanthine-guanine phosphoribosyltransferase [Thiorhodovibrio]MBK5967844.1 hypoxanthine-guanine phosphoribosyltransferase [Thiorhodovibrio winogradskyi]WPL11147.1 Hypoxanthine-guanine phosphoribosyltransferase [Thiorhodovibrio litoralis]